MTFRVGFTRQMLDSETWRSGATTDVSLRRNILNNSVNAELPLTESDFGLGKPSAHGRSMAISAFSDLSDFGGLMEYGVGLRWQPTKSLTFQASLIGDENAPGIGQFGQPGDRYAQMSPFSILRPDKVRSSMLPAEGTLRWSRKSGAILILTSTGARRSSRISACNLRISGTTVQIPQQISLC